MTKIDIRDKIAELHNKCDSLLAKCNEDMTKLIEDFNEKYGARLFLHYGFAELWIEPQEGKRLTTIIGGVCIYYNL